MTTYFFAEICSVRKLESPGYRVAFFCVILHLAISEEHRLVTDGWIDRRTDRHMTTANTRGSLAKNAT